MVGEFGEDLLVELVLLIGSVEGGGDRNDLGGVGWVSRSWETRVLGLEGGESLVTEVQGLRSIPFGVVGDEEFGGGEGFGEGFLERTEEVSLRLRKERDGSSNSRK